MKFRRCFSMATALVLSTSLAWSGQLGQELNEADIKLNAVYHQVWKSPPSDAARERLKAEQRAWVTSRNAEMRFPKVSTRRARLRLSCN